jgi:hypothetical protein
MMTGTSQSGKLICMMTGTSQSGKLRCITVFVLIFTILNHKIQTLKIITIKYKKNNSEIQKFAQV